jgi:signal transduction histidine kinase
LAISETRIQRPGGFARRERTAFIFFTLFLALPVAAFVGVGAYGKRAALQSSWEEIVVWTLAFALLNLFDLKAWGGRILAPDVPVLLAICLTFPPALAGLIAFVGTLDPREFSGQMTLTRSLFNRTQGAILAILPAAVAQLIPHSLGTTWWLTLSTASCLLVLTVANYVLISIGGQFADDTPFLQSVQNLVLGRPVDFATTWLAWGLLGMLLVAAESSIGTLAIVVFIGPALIGRQVLARSRSTLVAEANAEGKQRAVNELSSRIFDERRDERESIASHLHDEVLQPLYQVSLMCDVVKQDTVTGRLLELDKDVPLLNLTVSVASKNLRGVIGRLRNSPIGIRGLPSTLRGLVKDLEPQSKVDIRQAIEDVRIQDPALQLTIYQVAKEALTNAIRHARARRIHIRLMQDEDAVRLTVEDNGLGFDPRIAEQDHFGLLIMRERTESAGGVFLVDSRLGEGTIVAARFPNQSHFLKP